MIEAGLDAINISVDAVGQGGLRVDAHRPEVRQGDRQHRAARADPRGARQAPAEADPVLRPAEQLRSTSRRSSSTGSSIADKIHVTDLHNWAGTLNTESDVNYPCYRPWLTFTVLWDGRVSLCCADFDGRTVLGDLTPRPSRRSGTPSPTGGAPPAPRERRARHLPVLRPAAQRLPALDYQARLRPTPASQPPAAAISMP